MTNDPDEQSLREFLDQVGHAGRVRLELVVDVEVDGDTDQPALKLADDMQPNDWIGQNVQIRVESTSGGNAWVANAEWSERSTLSIRTVRPIGSAGATLRHSRTSYRVAVPPSSVAALHRIDKDESVSVEPVDLSRGGVGLRAEDDVVLDAGEEVEVDLNIVGEFAGTLPGRVAFARQDEDREQLRVGVTFDTLDDATADALHSALNNILLGQTREIAE